LWEGDEKEQDCDKGEKRKKWRDDRLLMADAESVTGLPIHYGRRSESRNGQFSMVLGGAATGTAKVAPILRPLPLVGGVPGASALNPLQDEVTRLAKAEGIWRATKNENHWYDWGMVAIALNPASPFAAALRAIWIANFKLPATYNVEVRFGGLVDANGELALALPWDAPGLKKADFCLCTPTQCDQPPPSPKEIAKAIKLSSYFHRTRAAGISTGDDAAIIASI
jgi:hypothetical protein